MDKVKELFENKLFRMLAIVIGAVLVIIIVIMIVMAIQGKRVSGYTQLEAKLVSAAKDYYQENSSQLPAALGTTAEVDSTQLTQDGYMKNIAKIAPKNATCTGRVVVKNVNQSYFYQAFVDCGDSYKTSTFANYIKSHVSTVSVGAGLYANNQTYIYRGENPNNYVEFAGRMYRIVQLNEDNTIDIITTEKADKVVFDDRFNQDRNGNEGINDYRVSRVRDSLLAFVNSKSFTDVERSMLVPYSLCLGKVGEDSEISLGMECSDVLENQVIGLLPVSSYAYASLDATCKTPSDGTCANYNYLETDYNWWTLTGDAANTYRAFSVQVRGSAYSTRSASTAVAREVLRLTDNTVYVSGDGTFENPYIIK